MATVGALKYQISADTNQLNAAMVATKAQMREAAKIMRETATPAQELQTSLDRTQKLYELGVISLEAYGQKMVKLKSSTPEAMAAQRAHSEAMSQVAFIIERNKTAQERFNESLEHLKRLQPHMAVDQYDRELKRLNATSPEAVAKQKELAEATAEAARQEKLQAETLSKVSAIVERNKTAQERYNTSLEELKRLQPHMDAVQYERELLRLNATLPDVAQKQRQLNTAMADAAAITARNLSPQERHLESLKRLEAAKPHLSVEAYKRELQSLNATLPSTINAERRKDEELREGLALTRSLMTAEEQRSERLRTIDRLLKSNTISQETYNRAVASELQDIPNRTASSRASSGIREIPGNRFINEKGFTLTPSARAMTQLGPGIPGAGLMGGMGSMAQNALAAAGGLSALAIGKQIFTLTAQVETASAAFEVLIGDASRANQMIGQMKSLDKASMLDFNTISQAGKTLLGYGTAVETVIPSLDALSEISMGNKEKFQSLALAFGQVQARGRMTAEEVRQMVNAGFNPLQEIARVTGTTLLQVQDRMAEGAISADMVTAALKSAVAEGGRFNGMNEKLGKTGAGQLAKLGSDLQSLAIRIGTMNMPIVTEGLKSVRGVVMGIDFALDKMYSGFEVIGATLTGNLDTHLRTLQAAKDQVETERILKEVAEEQLAIEKIKADLQQRETERKELNRQADWLDRSATPGDRTADEARGIVNAHKAAEEFAKLKETQFKTERDAYFDELKSIDEKYQKLYLGEEKYKSLLQERKLALPEQAKVLGGNEDLLKAEADRKLVAIKRMEADQLAIKEREKAEKEAAKKKEQEEKVLHDKRLAMAAEIVKKNNPMAALAEKIREIDDLRKRGLIDSTNHAQARNEAIQDAATKDGSNTSATVATITRGSVEEYKQRYSAEKQQVDKTAAAMAVQTTIAKLQLEQQKQTNTLLAQQPELLVGR